MTGADAHPTKLNGFWKSPLFALIVGQALAFGCWLVLAAVAWGKLSDQFEQQAKWRIEMEIWKAEISRDGTDNFKYGHYEDRLRTVEEATKKIDAILQGQERMSQDIKDIKSTRR